MGESTILAKEETSQAISKESIGLLEDVKKGKPRKFAMICKGTNIVSLVVYKKGSIENRKKEAKEAGKGQFYFGVIDGRGQEISFKLARADGFDSAPVKTVVLKQFLEEEADLKFKPLFEIVDTLSLVLDDSDPLVQRFLALQEAAYKAADQFPDRAEEINRLCMEIGKNFDQDQSENARIGLEQLESLLSSLGTLDAGTASPTPSAGSSPADALNKALGELVPRIKEVVAGNPNAKTELLELVASVKEQIAGSEFDKAEMGIASLREKLEAYEANAGQQDEGQGPLVDWTATRTWAIDQLRKVAKSIAEEKQPESAKAIIELKAVISNLTETPNTPQMVAELRRWLEQDDVVSDVCNFALDIRSPLLAALPSFDENNG